VIRRYSSRQARLSASFLSERLEGATSYDRIAGYFSSSILEVAGEQLERISGKVRIICNSELQPLDVLSARQASMALRQEWCSSSPETKVEKAPSRFARLRDFLRSGKLEVKVLPSHRFGLVHGKAGVITKADGRKTSFMGSANESKNGWELNYELVWEDDSDEAVTWVQEEFDALWACHEAFPLAEAVIEDIERLARRTVIPSAKDWRESPTPNAASPIIETPVYRKQYGLWAHQKFFVERAFEAHRSPWGARYVLADMVGLGKTVQLAMAAMLMALWGDKPVLIIAPKPLLWQWQDEMLTLLDMPSAVWNGKQWVDENEIVYPVLGAKGVLKCPRRVGLVSQGLFTANSEAAQYFLGQQYECIILDEAHRARRANLGPDREAENPEANNLMAWMKRLAPLTRSLLLATATPVQLYPVEAWDLLDILAVNTEHVLGNGVSSLWRRPEQCLPLVTGREVLPDDDDQAWNWMRNPLPPKSEGRVFEIVRRALQMSDAEAVAKGSDINRLGPADRQRLRGARETFGREHNPFIRHIIRRTRDFLETTINAETNLPYLQPVRVELLGEDEADAIPMTDYLREAYAVAEQFCTLLAQGRTGAGFFKTLLLRRLGSSVLAGQQTAQRILDEWEWLADDPDEDEEEDEGAAAAALDAFRSLKPAERSLLETFVQILEANQMSDPKFAVVVRLLKEGHPAASPEPWLSLGCMIFSQYYDSAQWIASRLSAEELPGEPIGLYAGSGRSALYRAGVRQSADREDLKALVRTGELRLLIGTDAASEGLNLQRLGTLINLDLPWNPTRLEQRKGRIQRIGQKRDTVFVYNMRYRGSVEDRVHQLLSQRLAEIHGMFGQVPDTLEDVWIRVALGEVERAKKIIGGVPKQHPFEARYNQIANVKWETCSEVLNSVERRHQLLRGWS
jgi:superfamily II DNA or RNA helicase